MQSEKNPEGCSAHNQERTRGPYKPQLSVDVFCRASSGAGGAQCRKACNADRAANKAAEGVARHAEQRGIEQDDWVGIKSRAGETVLRADVTERVQPGVVYTTFHHPESGANVVTTDNSDWATNCPEYKVTAVQAYKVTQLSDWQQEFEEFTQEQLELLKKAKAPAQVI